MKELARDVLLGTIIFVGLVTCKITLHVKKFFKPKKKRYVCCNCHEDIPRGTGIFIGKQTTCLKCFTKGRGFM